jgi:hypothetical protein
MAAANGDNGGGAAEHGTQRMALKSGTTGRKRTSEGLNRSYGSENDIMDHVIGSAAEVECLWSKA